MKKLLLSAVLALGALTGAATAATVDIDGLVHSSAGGFGSSLIHAATGPGGMSGATKLTFDEAVNPGGLWKSNGSISWSGTFDGGTYTADGHLDQDIGSYAPGVDAGSIFFSFVGGVFSGQTIEFVFKGLDMGLPNDFDGSMAYLWGGQGSCTTQNDLNPCVGSYGIDLRIATSSVPLPAPALLLLAGLGAIGVARRKSA